MRLLVTGGSSFVGAHLCLRLARHHEVVAVHHSTPLALNGVTPLRVDLRNPRAVRRLRAVGADAVVHAATRIRVPGAPRPAVAAAEVNRRMMDAVLSLGLPVLYLSSTAVHWKTEHPYVRSRREDEARLRESGLPHAVLRPSAPYGPRLACHRPRHVESFHRLADAVRRWPAVPVPGSGRARRQPVHVDDLAAAALALLDGGLDGGAFDAGGPEPLTLDEIVAAIGRVAGRRPRVLHVPARAMAAAARLVPGLDPGLVAAMEEDEVVDPEPLAAATGMRPRPFEEGAADLLR